LTCWKNPIKTPLISLTLLTFGVIYANIFTVNATPSGIAATPRHAPPSKPSYDVIKENKVQNISHRQADSFEAHAEHIGDMSAEDFRTRFPRLSKGPSRLLLLRFRYLGI
jgi:hypothetical protein